MQTRRKFIGDVATGLAGTFATGRVLGANDRVRIGVIGIGDRGTQLVREAAACPGTEVAALADVYARRLQDAAGQWPGVRACADYRHILDDPSIDAVLIATPQHLHAEQFIATMAAGRHVYLEKAAASTVEQAKQMRAAFEQAGRVTVQIGHQCCSLGQVADAANYLGSGAVGQVTAIRARMYRNTPHGKPQWRRPLHPDMTAENIDWASFLGGAPSRGFNSDRYLNWRLYEDYSGGNVHESMSQQISFWYKVMDLGIPHAVTMTGGIYRWNDGREVPDTMSVAMVHSKRVEANGPGQTLLFSWDSGFGNNDLGVSEDVLGTDGTVSRRQQIRYLPQKVNRPAGEEMLGQTPTPARAHMQNFLDSLRSGKPANCPFEIGYRVSIACSMAVASYHAGRTVRWDPIREEIL